MPTTATKPRILVNAAANGLGFLAQIAVAFLLTPVLIDALGDARNGVWSLVESILAYLTLFDLGVAASVVRHVARFEAHRDQDTLNRVFSTSFFIFAGAGAIAWVITLILAFPAFGFLNVPGEMAVDAREMLLILGANLALGLPMSVFPCVLDGLGRYTVKTAIRTGVLLLRALVIMIAIGMGKGTLGLLDVAVIVTLCYVVEYVLLALAAYLLLPGLRCSLSRVDRPTFRLIRGYSLDAFLAMIAGRVSFQTDSLVIGRMIGAAPITYFALAARLTEYAKNALRALTTVLAPAVSTLDARGDGEGVRKVYLDSTRHVLWLIVPIQVGLLLLGRPFLVLWMGDKYADLSYPTLAILAVPLSLATAQSVAARVLYGVGKLKWFARAMMLEALCNLILSVILAGPMGIEGVALGTAIPNFIMNVVVMVSVCRLVGLGLSEYFCRAFAAPCVAGFLLAAGWWLTGAADRATSWGAWLTVGSVGTAGFALIAALVEAPIFRSAPSRSRVRTSRLPSLTEAAQQGVLQEDAA
jgi:O-antigen/teichoic acid export membrane protein